MHHDEKDMEKTGSQKIIENIFLNISASYFTKKFDKYFTKHISQLVHLRYLKYFSKNILAISQLVHYYLPPIPLWSVFVLKRLPQLVWNLWQNVL